MAASVELDLLKYKQVVVDDTGVGGITYYGVTENQTAGTADDEWAVLRETVAGTITTYQWAAHKDGKPSQLYAWDDRATLTY